MSGSDSGFLKRQPGFSSTAIHEGQEPEQWTYGDVVPPVSLSSTFKWFAPGEHRGFLYGRMGNPSRAVLEKTLAALDGASHALCFPSGIGAVTAVLQLLKNGDHVLSVDDIYGGTRGCFDKSITNFGVTFTYADATDPDLFETKFTDRTSLVWIETPSNPLLKVIDIKKISAMAHKRNVLVAVDNSFLTPYFQKPLELGADMAVYSLSKYMNGHTDVVMGSVTTNSEAIRSRMEDVQTAMGIVPSPFDCYLVTRGLKTLELRMDRHMANCITIAKYLENHPFVEKVLHPALPSHPQHELAKRQSYGHSGMVSFYIKGGMAQSRAFMCALKMFAPAGSLGGVVSLMALPAVMTHGQIPAAERKKYGITDNLLRLSVGIEDVNDLLEDLGRALAAAAEMKNASS